MKQLIMPHYISEVTMQREILTHPKIPPSTLDQGCVWLEEMQHRLNLCMKTGQQVHPRTIITFVQEVLSGITQYYRTVGNIWDSSHLKHQLRESNLTLDRVYAMLAEFLIELRLHEEQDKITQIVTTRPSSTACMMSTSMPAKGRCLPRVRASNEKAKVHSLSGDLHAMIIGSQAVAHKVIIARSITRGDNRVDVQYAVLPDMLPHSVLVQSNLRPRMPSGMSLLVLGKNLNGKTMNARLRSTKPLRARKERVKALSLKASLRERLRRGPLLQDQHSLHRRRMNVLMPNPNLMRVPA